MSRMHPIGAAILAALLVQAMVFTACKKKPAESESSAKTTGAGDMTAEDPDEPATRPVETDPQAMDPEAKDPEAMAPADKDPEDADREAATDPTLPEEGQATARMILIPWKDAEHLMEELKRTKEEAKTLAETVLKEARAKPTEAAFTALVNKHSSGPTKESGGKVGPFGPKDVPAYIAKAVFALKKGGISDLVETPSGYHIFMRTR